MSSYTLIGSGETKREQADVDNNTHTIGHFEDRLKQEDSSVQFSSVPWLMGSSWVHKERFMQRSSSSLFSGRPLLAVLAWADTQADLQHHVHLSLYWRGLSRHHRSLQNQFPPFFSDLHRLLELGKMQACPFPMLSSHIFFCLLCLLPPFTVPCRMVLARPDKRETFCISSKWSRGLHVVWMFAGSWHGLPGWKHCLCMKCIVSLAMKMRWCCKILWKDTTSRHMWLYTCHWPGGRHTETGRCTADSPWVLDTSARHLQRVEAGEACCSSAHRVDWPQSTREKRHFPGNTFIHLLFATRTVNIQLTQNQNVKMYSFCKKTNTPLTPRKSRV